jgi:hypothetical protein
MTTDASIGDGVVHTGSISSTVDLDYVHGEAHKRYHPSLPVRLMYRITFQAPFPYVANHGALEAARQRRIIVDLLTKYWYGHHLVAKVLDIADMPDGGHDFVTRLIVGREPADQKRAKEFLRDLDRKFLDAGLPTWQVTPYNPHSVTNFIELADGTYRIIDLESSLVACLYPVSRIFEYMRAGILPAFDDIDVARLRRYVAGESKTIATTLGDEYSLLCAAIDAYEAAARKWHASEPRLINRAFQAVVRTIDRVVRRK